MNPQTIATGIVLAVSEMAMIIGGIGTFFFAVWFIWISGEDARRRDNARIQAHQALMMGRRKV